jgi:GcrA cell cycle regulator
MSWTDERINLLKRMWKEGKSAAEIAKTLGKGVTRNAVIGKAHRMGLSGRPSPIKKPPPAKKSASVKKNDATAESKSAPASAKGFAKKTSSVPQPPATAKKKAPGEREVAEPYKMIKEAIPPGGGVALIDLSERMCKWPIGDPREPDFTFCGRPIRQGTPYCPDHAAMAYQTSSRRGAVAANEDKEEDVVDDEEDTVEDDEDSEETVA